MENNRLFRKLTAILFVLLLSTPLFADGSKDLYPADAQGYRAVLYTGTSQPNSWPFPNKGVHYVYANPGEYILMASSTQRSGNNQASIELYAPNGNRVVNSTNITGNIPGRAAELAGPQLRPSDNTPNRYTPVYYQVPANSGGLYRVQFTAGGSTVPSSIIPVNSNWSQSNNSAGIIAWDVSVTNSTRNAFISGRVYANVLNLSNGYQSPDSVHWYGKVYALTRDGYTYRVTSNGSNGMYFTFFINNNGFLDSDGFPLYKSLDGSTASFLSGKVQDPNTADTAIQATHKMFYTHPDKNMPATTVSAAVPGGETWLNPVIVPPHVSNLSIEGVEGTPGQMSYKGGYIYFDANQQGNYKIIIKSTATPEAFPQRVLSGPSLNGPNAVFWDGKDGNDNPIPVGDQPLDVEVQLQGAEVHFPFIDMEYNAGGIIIELLDADDLENGTETVISDLVYWDDSDLSNRSNGTASSPKNNSQLPPVNSSGISSNVNGHKFGAGASGISGQFGDNRSIDTWAFIQGDPQNVPAEVVLKVADLMISSLTSDRTSIQAGQNVTYTIAVKNDGPSDADGAGFAFAMPAGFTPVNMSFSGGSCGTESIPISYDSTTHTYSSELNLPDGCEITYQITVKATTALTEGAQIVEASVLRPNDVTDPDATNPDPEVPPADPHYECDNSGMSDPCNNIMINNTVVFGEGGEDDECILPVRGNRFSWRYGSTGEPPLPSSGVVEETVYQPGADAGFIFDIYELDNSFNMEINGILLATEQIEFQSSATPGINVQFKDGEQYESNGRIIWQLEGNEANPILRVEISPTGEVKLYGVKTSFGPLYEMEPISGLTNSFVFNTIVWGTNSENPLENMVKVIQDVTGPTVMDAYGYGNKLGPCPCVKPGNSDSPYLESAVGITLKGEVLDAPGGWPKAVPNGYLVLDAEERGMVITHTTPDKIANPVEGMLIFDTDAKCIKMYRGLIPGNDAGRTGWNCLERGCNDDMIPDEKVGPVNVGLWTNGASIPSNQYSNILLHFANPANYGPSGTFKGVQGISLTDLQSSWSSLTPAMLLSTYDVLVVGLNEISGADALKIKTYAEWGGAVLVFLSQDMGTGLNEVFGGYGNAAWGVGAATSNGNSVNNGVFGDAMYVGLSSTTSSGRFSEEHLPPNRVIFAWEDADSGQDFPAVWATGPGHRVVFVWSMGAFGNAQISPGGAISNDQDRFINNLSAYILLKAGFSED